MIKRYNDKTIKKAFFGGKMRSINRFSMIAAALVLVGILTFLSIWYYQNEKNSAVPANPPTAAQKNKAPAVPQKKLTEEEKDALRVEREAARTGQNAAEFQQTAENNPEEQMLR